MLPGIIVYDIETYITDEAKERFESMDFAPDPKLAPLNAPPKTILNLKNDVLKASRVIEWQEDQAKKLKISAWAAREKAIDKAALNWWTGKVVCISAKSERGGETFYGHDEKWVLNQFAWWCNEHLDPSPVAKNGEGFDRPFLIGRYMAHDLGVPRFLKSWKFRAQGQPLDLDWIWGFGSNAAQVGKLSDMAFGLGLESKSADGSQVGEMVKNDEWHRLRDYCIDDRDIVFEIVKRYIKLFSYLNLPLSENINGKSPDNPIIDPESATKGKWAVNQGRFTDPQETVGEDHTPF